jgi:hypothetical protein
MKIEIEISDKYVNDLKKKLDDLAVDDKKLSLEAVQDFIKGEAEESFIYGLDNYIEENIIAIKVSEDGGIEQLIC